MPIALNVTHTTAADGTFSAAGAIEWNRAHTAGFTGLTANALLLSDGTDLTQDGTNLLYTTTSGPRLQVGSGNTTSAGLIFGYSGTYSSYGMIWSTGVTPAASNYAFGANSVNTIVNVPANGQIVLSVNEVAKQTILATAGYGISISAGTAATDVNALSATQTWNAGAVAFTGWKFTITDTASAAGALAMQIFGGAAGTTSLFKVTKAGKVDAPAYAVNGTDGLASFNGAVTNLTVVNGIVTAAS